LYSLSNEVLICEKNLILIEIDVKEK
jgi:hypothetical protein